MTRRELFASAIAAAALRGQSLPERVPYRDYPRVLPDYLRGIVEMALERRRAAITRLTTPDAVHHRQQWARQTFLQVIGGLPERTPLATRVTGEFERSAYRVQKLVYESQPGLLVSANLYIPKSGSPPFPGVLFQMGHSGNGKAADTYQRGCQGLAQLGYVVLAFDPIGQGERINYPGPSGATRLSSVDEEHTRPGRQMLLLGDTMSRWQLWDAIRSLDVLAGHPLVDKNRLASTGQSGGATLTMLLACVDDRLTAAAVSSGNTENIVCADFHPPGATDDAEQDFVGSVPLGFDRWDVLWPFAPRPLLILTSAKDFFGTYSPTYESNGLEEYGYLRSGYSALGAAEKIERRESPLPHGFSYEQRVEVYRFFERWLKGSDKRIDREPPVQPEAEETLLAARGLKTRTPFEMIRERAASIATPSAAADLAALLKVQVKNASAKVLGEVASDGCKIRAIDVASVPAWIFDPGRAGAPVLLVLDSGGRNHGWQEGGLYHRLAQAGTVVCAADVRGIGDLSPEFSHGAPGYEREHQDEENYAWGSLILGRPLIGQRVTDILALVDALGDRITIASRGRLTVPVLCAAAMDKRIAALYLAGHLLSWRNIVETENYTHPLSNFVPDVLRHTDLPQVAARVRRLTLAGVVDAAGMDVPLDRVRQSYPTALVEEKINWNFDRLSRLFA
jgi:dienelactone hydrolase